MEPHQDFLDKLKQSYEVNISVTGRKSKKRFSTPLWFILDEGKVILVPTMGSASDWFKNLVNDPQIELSVGGTGPVQGDGCRRFHPSRKNPRQI